MDIERIQTVPLREVWADEARDFTPWLLDNEDVLADALGVDLQLEGSEHPVGRFSLDVVGRDLTHDGVLIIENQLETSDHDHLGKLLTYAAGTDAQTVVWIAKEIREEHRQALDWINEHSDEDVRIFGIEIQAIRIGQSPAAPLLTLVSQPNDWQKTTRAATRATQMSGKGQLYVAFWTRYLDRVGEEHPDWTRARSAPAQNWMAAPSPIRGTGINPSFASGGRLRHEMYVDTGDPESTMELFDSLIARRIEFEDAYGRPLEWDPISGKRACRIADYRPGTVEEADNFDEFIDWFFDAGIRMRRALATLGLGGAGGV